MKTQFNYFQQDQPIHHKVQMYPYEITEKKLLENDLTRDGKKQHIQKLSYFCLKLSK